MVHKMALQDFLNKFVKLEAASGIMLFLATLLAMLWANSTYDFVLQALIERFNFIVNEGLMSIFFLTVGLELKRALYAGKLSFKRMRLPIFAAIGGMIIPALIYLGINFNQPEVLRGWSTPVATDIAFALGVLSLLGNRVPSALKLFLLALAIFDDLGAIIIIAFFYTANVSVLYLILSFATVLVLAAFNYLKTKKLTPFILFGFVLWYLLYKSGIHPTIAGVILALMIPIDPVNRHSPLHMLEEWLHPWVAFLIIPLFALLNAGLPFHDITLKLLTDGVVLGIVGGLFFGKQIGIFGFSWLMIKLGWAKLPQKTTWLQLYSVALICGIGFTMSLFLGTLSFQNEIIYLTEVRLGVLLGSLLSGLTGAILLMAFSTPSKGAFH